MTAAGVATLLSGNRYAPAIVAFVVVLMIGFISITQFHQNKSKDNEDLFITDPDQSVGFADSESAGLFISTPRSQDDNRLRRDLEDHDFILSEEETAQEETTVDSDLALRLDVTRQHRLYSDLKKMERFEKGCMHELKRIQHFYADILMHNRKMRALFYHKWFKCRKT